MKQFTNLQVEKLQVNYLNGIKFDNVATNSNGSLKIKGNISFGKPVIVNGDLIIESGLVNDIPIRNEIVNNGGNCGKMIAKSF